AGQRFAVATWHCMEHANSHTASNARDSVPSATSHLARQLLEGSQALVALLVQLVRVDASCVAHGWADGGLLQDAGTVTGGGGSGGSHDAAGTQERGALEHTVDDFVALQQHVESLQRNKYVRQLAGLRAELRTKAAAMTARCVEGHRGAQAAPRKVATWSAELEAAFKAWQLQHHAESVVAARAAVAHTRPEASAQAAPVRMGGFLQSPEFRSVMRHQRRPDSGQGRGSSSVQEHSAVPALGESPSTQALRAHSLVLTDAAAVQRVIRGGSDSDSSWLDSLSEEEEGGGVSHDVRSRRRAADTATSLIRAVRAREEQHKLRRRLDREHARLAAWEAGAPDPGAQADPFSRAGSGASADSGALPGLTPGLPLSTPSEAKRAALAQDLHVTEAEWDAVHCLASKLVGKATLDLHTAAVHSTMRARRRWLQGRVATQHQHQGQASRAQQHTLRMQQGRVVFRRELARTKQRLRVVTGNASVAPPPQGGWLPWHKDRHAACKAAAILSIVAPPPVLAVLRLQLAVLPPGLHWAYLPEEALSGVAVAGGAPAPGPRPAQHHKLRMRPHAAALLGQVHAARSEDHLTALAHLTGFGQRGDTGEAGAPSKRKTALLLALQEEARRQADCTRSVIVRCAVSQLLLHWGACLRDAASLPPLPAQPAHTWAFLQRFVPSAARQGSSSAAPSAAQLELALAVWAEANRRRGAQTKPPAPAERSTPPRSPGPGATLRLPLPERVTLRDMWGGHASGQLQRSKAAGSSGAAVAALLAQRRGPSVARSLAQASADSAAAAQFGGLRGTPAGRREVPVAAPAAVVGMSRRTAGQHLLRVMKGHIARQYAWALRYVTDPVALALAFLSADSNGNGIAEASELGTLLVLLGVGHRHGSRQLPHWVRRVGEEGDTDAAHHGLVVDLHALAADIGCADPSGAVTVEEFVAWWVRQVPSTTTLADQLALTNAARALHARNALVVGGWRRLARQGMQHAEGVEEAAHN
ncbi:unnamed protein product, partial [Symbiodinium sp. KB8]